MKKEEKKIGINIWDDYCGDGDGDGDGNDYIKEDYNNTYGYVESSGYSDEECKEILLILQNYTKDNNLLPETKTDVIYYDSETQYDKDTIERCKREYGDNFFFKRYQIMFKNLTHDMREEFVENISKITLMYKNKPLGIYTES